MYAELMKKCQESDLPQSEKDKINLSLISTAIAESAHNRDFVYKFNSAKSKILAEIGNIEEKVDKTSLVIFRACTESYTPSMCDSSHYGTTNQHYLSLAHTLLTGESYLFSDDGEITFVPWNVNANACDESLDFEPDLQIQMQDLLKDFSNEIEGVEEFLSSLGPKRVWRENTYNYDGIFVIEYHGAEIGEKTYYVLRFHIGGDVRGGYSDPYIFSMHYEDYFPQILESNEHVTFVCPECYSEETLYHMEGFTFDKKKKAYFCNKCGQESNIRIG